MLWVPGARYLASPLLTCPRWGVPGVAAAAPLPLPFQDDLTRIPVPCFLTPKGMPVYGHTVASSPQRELPTIDGDGVGRGPSPGLACPWKKGAASRGEAAVKPGTSLPGCGALSLLVRCSWNRHPEQSSGCQCPPIPLGPHLPPAPATCLRLPLSGPHSPVCTGQVPGS